MGRERDAGQHSLSRPSGGYSLLTVTDDSPDGFRDLSDAFTMFGESYKKSDPQKRGAFNLGEKYVLALCKDATITSTTGQVTFNENGRQRNERVKRIAGTEFRAHIPLTKAECDELKAAAARLIRPCQPSTTSRRSGPQPLREWTTSLDTVKGDAEGYLRRTERVTNVSVYEVLPGETAYLYEMGVPVVELNAKYHVSVAQKVPLNADRDNVKPAYLKAVYVELLNNTKDLITETDANANWVRAAASDPRCEDAAIKTVLDLRYFPTA